MAGVCFHFIANFIWILSFFIVLSKCDSNKPGENHNRPHITNENFVVHRDSGERFLINFYSDGCAKCEEYLMDFERVEKALKEAGIEMFDCNSKTVMQGLGVGKVPSLLYYREGVPTYFDGEPVAEDIIEWVVDSHDLLTLELHDDTFEHLTQAASGATTGDWFVVFCIRVHADCNILKASLERVALQLLNKVNVAWVDINHNPELKDRFNLKKPTELFFFRHGKKYDYHLPSTEYSNLLGFASGAYQHSKAEDVVPPKTPFDKVTEKIAEKIKPNEKVNVPDEPVKKAQVKDNVNLKVEVDENIEASTKPFLVIAAVCMLAVFAVIFFLFFRRGSGGRQMKKGV